MDSQRFDSLTRRLASPATRRRALSAAATSGILGALGLGRGEEARAAQLNGGICSIPFTAVVRTGPSAERPLTRGGQPGELSGTLQFSLGGDGILEQASLKLADGTSLPVVGQATGLSLQVRIQLAQNLAVVAVGVGEQAIAACAGAIDGPSSGPQVGDIGDWHAGSAAQQAAGSGGKGNRNRDNTQAAAGSQGGRGNRTRGQGGGQAGAGAAGAVNSGGNGGGGGGGGSGGGRNGGRTQGGGNAGGGTGGNRTTQQQPVPPLADGSCPPQRDRCGETCHDLGVDPENCGQCGIVCNAERFEVCANGLCVGVACENNQEYCGPDVGCVSLEVDHDHCGRCGNMCLDSQCVDGRCTGTSAQCANGETLCDDECTDLNFDDLNCGRCGNMCAISDVCTDGVCGPVQCPEGTTLCGMACVNLQTSPQNCGTCEISCAADQFCNAGVCTAITTCPSGETFCRDAGGCRYLFTDQANCGECGVRCIPGWDCRGGQCIDGGDPTRCVQPGLYYCNGECVQIEFDPRNCGLCGITCGADQVCQQFSCISNTAAAVCPAGQNYCSGACVDLMNDSNNCGMCGTSCGGPQCVQGFCGGPDTGFDKCAARGYTNCNDICVVLDDDPFNCGACGVICPDGGNCVSGTCDANDAGAANLAPTDDCLAQGLTSCNENCVDVTSDVFNCGGCGSVCGVFDACIDGMCTAPEDQTQPITDDTSDEPGTQPQDQPVETTETAPVVETQVCDEGLTDCSGICANLAADSANCGACGFSCGIDACVDGFCTAPVVEAPVDVPEEIPADAVVEEVPLTEDCSAQGLTDCGGACIDTSSDSFNCGGCGLICEVGQICSGGACLAA